MTISKHLLQSFRKVSEHLVSFLNILSKYSTSIFVPPHTPRSYNPSPPCLGFLQVTSPAYSWHPDVHQCTSTGISWGQVYSQLEKPTGVGWKMATRRCIHFLIPRTCECYLIWPKRNYCLIYKAKKKKKQTKKHTIKLRILRRNAYPGLSVWVPSLSHVRLFETPWTAAC